MLTGKNALLFADNDAADLCRAFDKLPEVREKIIAGGAKTAAAYDWKEIAARLTTLYRELQG